MSRRLTEDQRNLILKDLRLTNLNLRQISERRGVSLNQVWRVAHPLGLRPQRGRRMAMSHKVRGTDVVANLLREAFEANSLQYVADTCGYTSETFRYLRDGGRHGQLGAFLALASFLNYRIKLERIDPDA